MTWAHRASVTAHRCRPPTRERVIKLPTGPAHRPTGFVQSRLPLGDVDGRLGDVWRCDDCRKLWRVGRACAVCDLYGEHAGGGSHVVGLRWRPATLWQRLRYRRTVAAGDPTSQIPGPTQAGGHLG